MKATYGKQNLPDSTEPLRCDYLLNYEEIVLLYKIEFHNGIWHNRSLFSLLLFHPERITDAIIFGSALSVQRTALSRTESNIYLLKF